MVHAFDAQKSARLIIVAVAGYAQGIVGGDPAVLFGSAATTVVDPAFGLVAFIVSIHARAFKLRVRPYHAIHEGGGGDGGLEGRAGGVKTQERAVVKRQGFCRGRTRMQTEDC